MSTADRRRLKNALRDLGVHADSVELREAVDAVGGVAPQYGPTPDFVGPMSPQQLADLDRVLTPAEQAAVTAYQSGEANAQLAEVRKSGGPRSKTVEVTERGAVIQARPVKASMGIQWWQIALGALGVAVVGGGVYALARKKRGRK